MIQYVAAMLALAGWTGLFETSPRMSSSAADTIPPAQSTFAEGAGANAAIHRVPIALSSFNPAVSPVSIEATIEPEWLDWTGMHLVCQDDRYQGQARVGDGQAFLRVAIAGTVHSMNAGLWLVTYRLEMQLGNGSQIKRLAAAGSAVCKEGERAQIATIGGLSVFLRVSLAEANIRPQLPRQNGGDSRRWKRASQGGISDVLHVKQSPPRRK